MAQSRPQRQDWAHAAVTEANLAVSRIVRRRYMLAGPVMTEVAVQTHHGKFRDPDWTASGERRAQVPLQALRTLWINTGSLCNIECRNCYIESSPENDRLVYIDSRRGLFLPR